MKDFLKLTKENGKFYLTAFCVALLFVVSNNIYLMRDVRKQYAGGKEICNLAYLFLDKADGYDLVGFWLVLVGLVVIMLIRYVPYIDMRKMEFQMFLPVKKRTIVLQEYLCTVLLIVALWLVSACTYGVVQGSLNRAVIQGNDGMRAEAAFATRNLWSVGGCYLLYLIFICTLLYLGLVICKNGIVGMVFMLFLWGMEYFMSETIYDDLGYTAIMSPGYFIESIMRNETPQMVILLVVLILICLIFMMLAAEKRELSKGKWFYFSWIDYPVIFLLAIFIVVFCLVGLYMQLSVSLIAGIVVYGILFYLHNRGKTKKTENWEVK